jgi:hypothetical protein
MSTSRTPASSDSFRINTKPRRIGTNPSNRRFSVLNTGVWVYALSGFHTVIGKKGDNASLGKISGVFLKLANGTPIPSATKEENSSWALISRGIMSLGFKTIDPQIITRCVFIDFRKNRRIESVFFCLGEEREVKKNEA